MNEMVDKIQKKNRKHETMEEETSFDSDEVFQDKTERSSDQDEDQSNDESAEDQSFEFDFRTRASFRALIFRTYTLTKSSRLE